MPRTDGASTRAELLAAAAQVIATRGYAGLSTRTVAETAGMPLSQIHYHFGSKLDLVLATFEEQNRRLLSRQTEMFASAMPLWKQWEQACDFLDDDLRSGYVRLLQEMIAAGWSDDRIGSAAREQLGGWNELLVDVARRAADRHRHLGLFSPEEFAALAMAAFLGVGRVILLGFSEQAMPARSALRRIGQLLQKAEEAET